MADSDYLQITNLTRSFGEVTALQEINLSIARGELFGLVGPDGAGKTTLLRSLAGLLQIQHGRVTAAGCSVADQAEQLKRRIGYMAQEFSLYEKLTVRENLTFFAELYDVDLQEQRTRIASLLEFAGLRDFQDRRAAHLSGGMKKKLALICTLLHRPPLLLLDEPTTGVDPISRREFWGILSNLHLKGTTILVSTPYMDEADRCSRVGLLFQGELVVCETPDEIRGRLDGELIKIIADDWLSAREVLEDLPGILEIQTYGEALHILVDSREHRLPQLKEELEHAGLTVREARAVPPRMEEAFISLIREMRRRVI